MDIKSLAPEFRHLDCWCKNSYFPDNYWKVFGDTPSCGTHIQAHPDGGYAGNSEMPQAPFWVTPVFATKEECAVYLTMMENTQTQEK